MKISFKFIHFNLMSFSVGSLCFSLAINVGTIILWLCRCSSVCAQSKKLLSIVQLFIEWIWNYSFSLNWISLKWSFVYSPFVFMCLVYKSLCTQFMRNQWNTMVLLWWQCSKTLFFFFLFQSFESCVFPIEICLHLYYPKSTSAMKWQMWFEMAKYNISLLRNLFTRILLDKWIWILFKYLYINWMLCCVRRAGRKKEGRICSSSSSSSLFACNFMTMPFYSMLFALVEGPLICIDIYVHRVRLCP